MNDLLLLTCLLLHLLDLGLREDYREGFELLLLLWWFLLLLTTSWIG